MLDCNFSVLFCHSSRLLLFASLRSGPLRSEGSTLDGLLELIDIGLDGRRSPLTARATSLLSCVKGSGASSALGTVAAQRYHFRHMTMRIKAAYIYSPHVAYVLTR
jgi:hypothetical protein